MLVTSKGQITIPIALRNKLGLLPNTEVAFFVYGYKLIVKRVEGPSRRGNAVIESMRGRATTRLTTDEIMALTRGK